MDNKQTHVFNYFIEALDYLKDLKELITYDNRVCNKRLKKMLTPYLSKFSGIANFTVDTVNKKIIISVANDVVKVNSIDILIPTYSGTILLDYFNLIRNIERTKQKILSSLLLEISIYKDDFMCYNSFD